MDKDPEISVISACYNHGKYINEMLGSVLNQSFQDFEVIIINDGSNDETRDILKNFTHEKVRIIHTLNHGPAFARNLAIENARGKIILNLDADDKIAPSLLEKAYNVFCTNSRVGIVYCDAECFGAKSGRFEIGEYTLESMLFDNRITSLAFFRKKDWESVGGYSDELIYGLEDWDFWLLIIELGRDVVKIPGKLVYYRTYKNSDESRSGKRKKDRMKSIRSLVTIFQRHKKLYSDYPLALEDFSRLEKKLNSENFLLRQIKNFCYNNLRIN